MRGVKAYFETNAKSFDALYDEETTRRGGLDRLLRPAIPKRANLALSYIQKFDNPSILDVGCGSGRNAVSFLKAGASRVDGIDFSQPMLDLAVAHAKKSGLEHRLSFECQDFLTWEPGGRVWDLVICLGFMEYFSDIRPLLKKIHGVCGRAVLFSIRRPSLVRMPVRKLRYMAVGCPIHFYRKAEIEQACTDAGFTRLEFQQGGSASYFVAANKPD